MNRFDSASNRFHSAMLLESLGHSMKTQPLDLWTLVRGRPQIDPNDLADAVVAQTAEEQLDYRTRLLIRDSIDALESYWGKPRAERWLVRNAHQNKITAICQEDHEKVGFPSIRKRLMEKTDPKTVEQYFRELSLKVHKTMRLPVCGSIALIVPGLLTRHTDDIDIVDEVPAVFREQHDFIQELEQRYGLLLTHFQQHDLPSDWSNRLQYHDSYGELQIYFVDPVDIFLGKLTSIRTKDLDDLRMLAPQLDKATIVQRLRDTMQSALPSESLKERAKNNWYVLFGEDLPS